MKPDNNPDVSYQTKYYHRERGKIMDSLGGKCCECKDIDYLEIHHIIGADLPKGRPTAQRIRDWKEQLSKNNLMLLCKKCHDKITHHHKG